MRISAIALPFLACFAFACGGKSKPPSDPPPLAKDEPATNPAPGSATPAAKSGPLASQLSDAEWDQLMTQVVAFFGDLGATVGAAGTDCKKMAKNITDVVAKNDVLLKRTKSFADEEVAAKRVEGWMQGHKDQVQVVFQKVAEGLKPCASDPDVNQAMQALGNAGAGG